MAFDEEEGEEMPEGVIPGQLATESVGVRGGAEAPSGDTGKRRLVPGSARIAQEQEAQKAASLGRHDASSAFLTSMGRPQGFRRFWPRPPGSISSSSLVT